LQAVREIFFFNFFCLRCAGSGFLPPGLTPCFQFPICRLRRLGVQISPFFSPQQYPSPKKIILFPNSLKMIKEKFNKEKGL
jgi:hypothetical protein